MNEDEIKQLTVETVKDYLNTSGWNDTVTAGLASNEYSLDLIWILLCAVFVFFMQAGFALVEVGTVSMKNTKNILTKNLLDACIGALSFWLIGYGLAFGKASGGSFSFIGTSEFALTGMMKNSTTFPERSYDGSSLAFFLFQFAFAATAATIVSGAVAERCQITAYFVYSFCITVFVYPVVVHWAWGNGWASASHDKAEDRLFGVGVIDFAGSAIVHLVGGCTAFIGALFLGPRHGRFDSNGNPNTMPHQSTTFQTVGVLILWVGWYGFNCGSTLSVGGKAADVAGLAAVTTTISATTSGLTATILGRIVEGHLNIERTNNGILGGLVSITAGCAVVNPEIAFVIGIIGGCIYFLASRLLEKYMIDDVVEASPVHLFCGAWGTLAAGIFATPANVYMAYKTGSCGLFYSCNGKGPLQFAANLVFVLVVIVWTSLFAILIFTILAMTNKLRVSLETEKMGLDLKEHGGSAYENYISRRISRRVSNLIAPKHHPTPPKVDTIVENEAAENEAVENEAAENGAALNKAEAAC